MPVINVEAMNDDRAKLAKKSADQSYSLAEVLDEGLGNRKWEPDND